MPTPSKGQLEPIIKGFMQQNNLRGEDAPALASAMADMLDKALKMLASQTKVAPGIAAPPGVTAAPGRLL